MRASIVLLLPLLGALQVCAQSRNYCAPTMCRAGFHVACTYRNSLGPTCVQDARSVTGGSYKVNFPRNINRVRNEIALGNVDGFEPAMRMATVIWNDELEKLAQIWVKQCSPILDNCRNTDRFTTVGQNIYTVLKTGTYDIPALIQEAVNAWFAESAGMDVANVLAYTPGDAYRNFAQLALDRVTAIGCAILQFTEGTQTRVVVVCNFASEPQANQPLYVEGCALAQCLRGRNNEFPGLCSTTEVFEPNFS